MKTIKFYVLSYIPTYLIGVDIITLTTFVQTKMDYPQLLQQTWDIRNAVKALL